VCVVANLRSVKDPLLAAAAARTLPAKSRIRVLHVGAALDPALQRAAEDEQRANPRYRWVGSLSRRSTLLTIARSRLLVLSSRSEGGANVISEAIVNDVPVLSSRIDGSLGLLGESYAGYFEVGDARGLAQLLQRAESDAAFLRELADACRALRPQFEPARERTAWAELLSEIAPGASRA
jgi:glycosyltransferase involved in cell wall biosynthesis